MKNTIKELAQLFRQYVIEMNKKDSYIRKHRFSAQEVAEKVLKDREFIMEAFNWGMFQDFAYTAGWSLPEGLYNGTLRNLCELFYDYESTSVQSNFMYDFFREVTQPLKVVDIDTYY